VRALGVSTFKEGASNKNASASTKDASDDDSSTNAASDDVLIASSASDKDSKPSPVASYLILEDKKVEHILLSLRSYLIDLISRSYNTKS